MLLLVVAWLGVMSDTTHLRGRSESSVEVRIVRVGGPAPSRIVVYVLGAERVPEVDRGVCIHERRRQYGGHKVE